MSFKDIDSLLDAAIAGVAAVTKETPVEVTPVQEFTTEDGTPFNEVFGFSSIPYVGFEVPVKTYAELDDVPAIDPDYVWQEELLANFALSKHLGEKVFLTGWAGTGKTTLSEQYAAHTGKPWHRENLTSTMEPDELFGRVQLIKDGEVSITQFVPTKFVRMLQQPAEICLDEIFAARPAMLQSLQRLFEDGGTLRISDGDLEIQPHPECTFTVTDNTKGEGDILGKFASRNVQDSSFLNRLEACYTVQYLSEIQEQTMVQNWAPKLDSSVILKLVRLANLVRAGYEKGDVSKTFSPRQLRTAAKRIQITGKVRESLRATFGNFLEQAEAGAFEEWINTVGL